MMNVARDTDPDAIRIDGSTNAPVSPFVVVIASDFSELADRALWSGLEWASRHEHGEVHVVSVVLPENVDSTDTLPATPTPDLALFLDGALERLRAHVATKLALFGPELAERGLRLANVTSHARLDAPAPGILQLASELEASLIVVGTHGRRGLARALMGSVAEATVRYSRCPVLVVPPREELPDIKIEPPCSNCVLARAASGGRDLWCQQHSEHHGRRHTYHQADRSTADGTFPLVLK